MMHSCKNCEFVETAVEDFPCNECSIGTPNDHYRPATKHAHDADFFWIGLTVGSAFSFALMVAAKTIGW